jgi:hypothetical protein
VLLLFAGVELAIIARDMSTKAVGLIAAGTAAKAPRTGGAERSNGAEQRASSARGGYTAQQGGWAWEVATTAGLERVTSWSCAAAGRRDVEMREMEIG